MAEHLKAHIRKFLKLDDETLSGIAEYFKPIEAKKKQDLHVEGRICTANYFVAGGCLRLFFVDEKGVEQTIQFAMENWWISDYTSFTNQTSSGYYIQAVEKSDVLALDHGAQEEMLKRFPQMERYFRIIHQRVHAASQFRMKYLYSLSKAEFYHLFTDHYPEFVQRVPQYLLASFLGLTPEYLSEIKSKRIS